MHCAAESISPSALGIEKMSQVPELSNDPSLPDEIILAALNGNLILFIGAGMSRLLDLPSWSGLADEIMEDLRKKEFFRLLGNSATKDLGCEETAFDCRVNRP